MYLLARFDCHRSIGDGNGDINYYISSYMNILEKAGLTTSAREIKRFLKSRIPIYNSEFPDTASRKRRIRRTKAIAKRFAFHNKQRNHQIVQCKIGYTRSNKLNEKTKKTQIIQILLCKTNLTDCRSDTIQELD